MGILSSIKHLGPLFLYTTGVLLFLRGIAGDGRWALMLVTLLIPLRNVVDKIQEFPLANQFIDLLVAGALIGCFISCSKQNKSLSTPSSLNIILIILIIYMSISLLLGNGYLNSPFVFDDRVKDLKNFCLMPLLFYITLNHITDRTWIIRMLMTMGLAFLIIDYYTVSQIHDFSTIENREKISGTFEYLKVNEVAAFFNQYTIILMSMASFIKDKRVKWALIALICIDIYCILGFYSRGAYLGLFAGMFFLSLFKNRKFLVPLVLLGIFWQSVLPEKVIERIKQTHDVNGQLDGSSQGRIEIWEKGMKLFHENPLTGIGFGVFRNLGFGLSDTHNIYVKYLAEQGLIGIVILLILFLCFLHMGYTLYKKGDDDLNKGMGLGLMACVIVLIINNFFGDRWSYMEISAYLWIFAGLVARLIILDQDPKTLPETQQTTKTTADPVQKPRKKLRYYDL